MKTKDEIRKEVLKKRERIPELMLKARSGIITRTLEQEQVFIRSDLIYVYVSLPLEVDTFGLIKDAWAMGKDVAVPKVDKDELTFFRLDSFEQLKEGCFHVLEPQNAVFVNPVREGLVIMPGVAFDKRKNRIGYGKGYYDRFLNRYPDHPTCALSFDFAVYEEIPAEEHDRRPDLLITDRRIIR